MSRPTPRPHAVTGTATTRHDPAPADLPQQLRDALAAALMAFAADPGPDAQPLRIARSPRPIAPAQLAAAHAGSAQQRQQARATYERCLHHYRTIVRPGDLALATDDVGAALSHFAAANIAVLQGVQATPAMRTRLERQLGVIVRASPAWQSATLRDRQAYAEQLGILSVLITQYAALAPRQGQPAIDNVRRGARGYLRQLLGIDPDALALGPDGLTLREAQAA
ncbi:DUF6683 family protein [Aquabacterium sp.]|uniref:DUF6683 family protein n=1 Tax=Aquabacterium sp. TaxID=1872578 RepID=UPI002CD17843|nr:DUF6683 family protein [Aquabacterium sp.]HSW08334.1 DUF6683 family protein [Aquabacterium sp.]